MFLANTLRFVERGHVSSFWTPSGEHEVPGETSDAEPVPGLAADTEIDPDTAAAMEQQLREAQEQLLSVTAG